MTGMLIAAFTGALLAPLLLRVQPQRVAPGPGIERAGQLATLLAGLGLVLICFRLYTLTYAGALLGLAAWTGFANMRPALQRSLVTWRDLVVRIAGFAVMGVIASEALLATGNTFSDHSVSLPPFPTGVYAMVGGGRVARTMAAVAAIHPEGDAGDLLRKMADHEPARLIALMNDPEVQVRRVAAEILGTFGDQRAVAALCAALRDSDSGVRRRSALGLGRIGVSGATASGLLEASHAVSALGAALRDPDDTVRVEAASALGVLHDPAAAPYLCATLREAHSPVRRGVARALGAIKDPTTVPALCAALKDPDEEVRREAASALGCIGDRRAIPHLQAALGDADQQVRFAATDALFRIAHPHQVREAVY